MVVGFRPEAAAVSADGGLPSTVYATDLHGSYTMLHLEMCGDQIVQVRASRETHYDIGEPVNFDLSPAMVRFYHPETEQAIEKGADS